MTSQRQGGAGIFDSLFGGKKSNRQSGPEKIEADLSWDAMAWKYLEMFEDPPSILYGGTSGG